jgi:hypothetical protein
MKPVAVDTRTKIPGVSNPNIGLYRRARAIGVLPEFLVYGPALFGISLTRQGGSDTVNADVTVPLEDRWRFFGV